MLDYLEEDVLELRTFSIKRIHRNEQAGIPFVLGSRRLTGITK